MAINYFPMTINHFPMAINYFPMAINDFPMTINRFHTAINDFSMAINYFHTAINDFTRPAGKSKGSFSITRDAGENNRKLALRPAAI